MDAEPNKITKIVAVYARVSTARQEEEGTIATQLCAVKDFADKNGFTIVKEYKDDGWSGDIIARPSLDQLRLDAKKKVWDAVLFYDPDRLARRYSYQELVMDELRELGIEPLFVTIPPSKNSEDRLMYGVKGIFAEYERIKIAERFRFGKVRKAKEGHIILAEGPYGYDFIPRTPEKQGYIKINKTESEVVKTLFNWVANDGLTLRAIVRQLQILGIKPRKSKRGVWNTSTLSTLLRNKTYIGEAHYGASYAVVPQNPLKKEIYKKIKKTSRRMRPEEEWIKIKTPVIIDKDLFDKAQRNLKSNFALCVRNKKNEYLLSGKIYCPCGKKRAGEGPQHGKHLYYRCTDRVYSYPLPSKCTENGLNARLVDKAFWEAFTNFMTSPDKISKYLQNWNNKKEDTSVASNTSIDQVNREIDKLKKEEERYVKAYGAEAICLEKLKEHTAEIKEKISSLKGQILYMEQQKMQCQNVILPSPEVLNIFCQKAKLVLNSTYFGFGDRQKMVRDIIERISQEKISETENYLIIEGYLNLNQDYYVAYNSLHRNCWFAECGKINII